VARGGDRKIYSLKGKIDFINPNDRVYITLNELNGSGSPASVSARVAGATCDFEKWRGNPQL
jgi:hypothetical protein